MIISARETELRQLRKSNTEFEEQNAILSKHIEKMKSAIDKLEVETVQQRNNNVALEHHLSNLRQTLAHSFSSVRLPGKQSVFYHESMELILKWIHSLVQLLVYLLCY